MYREKTEPVPDDAERENPHDSEKAMRFWRGQNLEPIIADLFELDTGHEVMRPREPIVRGIFRANLDRIVYEEKRPIPLQLKTATAYKIGDWGPTGSDEVPRNYIAQVTQEAMLLNAPYAYLAAFFGGMEYRRYRVERSPRLEELIIAKGEAFWRDHVEQLIPPDPDFSHPDTLDTVKDMYPGIDETSEADLSGDAWEAHREREAFKETQKAIAASIEACRARIVYAMGESAVGRFADGSGYRARYVNIKGYTVEPKQRKDIRFTKNP